MKGITRRLFSVVLTLAMVVSLMPLNCFIVYAGSGAILTNDQVIEKVIAVENNLKDSTGNSISDRFGSFSMFLRDWNINSFNAANAPTYILKSSSSGATCTVVFDEDTVASVTVFSQGFSFGGTTAVFTQGWVDITDQAQINAALTRLVGAYQDRDYPNYWFSISNGFSFNYCGKDAEFNRIAQKGNEYYLVIRDNGGLHGYTFIFDGDTMTNCYQVGIYPNSGIVSNYYQYPFIHKHTWSYAASGETLTYKSCQGQPLCAFTEEQSYSLTLSASSPNYFGSEATITIGTETEKTAWTGAGLTVPTAISYEKSDGTSLDAAPTVVGSYVAKVSPFGVIASETNTAEVSFTIEKINPTVTAPTAKEGLVYNGEAQSLVNAGSAVGGTMQYRLDEGAYSTSIPTATHAGTYTVYYKVFGDANHNDTVEASVEVTIAKANAVVTTAPVAKTLTYNGEAQGLVTEGVANGGTLEYSTDGTNFDDTVPTGTDAGTYQVWYKVKGDTNHNDVAAVGPISVTIQKATATSDMKEEEAYLKAYSGMTSEIQLDPLPDNQAQYGTPIIDEGAYFTLGVLSGGKITATYTSGWTDGGLVKNFKVPVTNSKNYQNYEIIVTVHAVNMTVQTVEVAEEMNVTYGDTAKVVAATNTTVKEGDNELGAIHFTVLDEDGGTEIIEVNETTGALTIKSVGTAFIKVQAQMDANSHYAPSDPEYIKVIVAPKTLTNEMLTLSSSTFDYDDEEHSPTITVMNGETALVHFTDYAIDNTSVVTAVNAGEYTVKIDGIGNYTGSVQKTWNINKINAHLTAPTAKTLTYTGAAQELVNAGTNVVGGTLQYKLGSGDYANTIPTATNAGSYEVWYKVVPDANHNGVDETKIEVIISMADPVVTAPTAKTGLVFNDSLQELVNAGSTTGGTLQYKLGDGAYSTDIPTATVAGTYTVYYKVVGDSNYNDVGEKSITVTMGAHTHGSWDYTADGATLTAECKAAGICTLTDKKVSLTISASDANYSGSPVTYGADSSATGKDIRLTGVEEWTAASLSYDVKYYIAYTDEEHNTPTSSTNGGSSGEGKAPKNVGSYIVVLKAKEGEVVKKTLAKSFSINAKTITSDFITLEAASKEYTGAEITNAVTVKDGENTLTVDTDYTVTGNKGTAKGSYTVTVTGTGNYKGTATKTWNIAGAIPTIVTNPAIGVITYGQKLSDSTLTDGVAKKGETVVPGTFAWKTPNVTPKVSDSNSTNYTIVFTPTDTENYGTVEFDAKVTVNKKTLTAKILNQTALETAGKTYTITKDMIVLGAILDADKGKVEVDTITGGNNPSIASAGTYELTATGLTLSGDASANYQVTSVTPGALTVKEPTGGVKINDADSGSVFVEVNKEAELPTTSISNMDKELASALLSGSDKTDVTDGQNALVYLDLKDGDKLASVEDVSKIEAVKSADETKGALLDLSLYKKIGGAEAEKITDISSTSKKVEVSIKVSDLRLPALAAGYTRTYSIIRLHDTTAERLNATVVNGKIKFSTDKFSLYQILYKDTSNGGGSNPGGGGGYNPTVLATEVKIDTPSKTELTEKGETLQLTASITPSYTTNKTLTWKSSEEAVVTVDSTGKVTAVGEGTATITVSTSNGKTTTIEITVKLEKNKDDKKPSEEEKPSEEKPSEEKPSEEKPGEEEKPSEEKPGEEKPTEEKPSEEKPGEEKPTEEKPSSPVTEAKVAKNTLSLNAGLKVSQTGKKVNVVWGKVADADGYLVYATYCGTKFGSAIKTIKNPNTTSLSITKLNGKAVDLKKNVKVYVKAYKLVDGKKVAYGKTITAHIVGSKSTTYTNVKKIKLTSKSKVTLKAGKTSTIKAKVVLVDSKKKQLSDAHAKQFRYATTNSKIVKVSKNGRITAVGVGTCYVYVYARNGYAKKIKVTVKIVV